MEDIEYLEEYEDLILPKTLNYSEEFPVNAIEEDFLDEPSSDLNPELLSEAPECADRISRCSPVPTTITNKSDLIKIINTELIRTPTKVPNSNKGVSISQDAQDLQNIYDRKNVSFLDRITKNPVLQRLDKYKSVATVKPTLQKKILKPSSISSPFASTDTKIQTISNPECEPKSDLNVPNKVIEDDSFLDYAVEKHGVDEFNIEFNLETAEISDICSDSLNFSDDYSDDIFGLDTLLSSEKVTPQNLKRKNNHNNNLEIDHKKSKYGNSLDSSKQMQKSGKNNVTGIFSPKYSINSRHPINVDKKKSNIPFEKRKINSNGKKSKLVVKKNGKKFVFPDRSKFSLKNLNNSSNVEEENQTVLATKGINVAPQALINQNAGETNKDFSVSNIKNTSLKIPLEKQENLKSSTNLDLEKINEKDIVIFSSPKNMKKIDFGTPIHQIAITPAKSTGLTFGQFSLKSIKPPSNLKIKETPPKQSALPHSENKDQNKLDKKANKTYIETEECLSISDKNNTINLQKNESVVKYKRAKESLEQNELVSNSNDKVLRTSENVDSSPGKNDSAFVKATDKTSNNKNEIINVNDIASQEKALEKLSKEYVYSTNNTTNNKNNNTFYPIDKSLKDLFSKNDSVSKSFSTEEKILETLSNDLDRSSLSKNENSLQKQVPRNIIKENLHSNKVNETDSSMEKCVENNYSKANVLERHEPLQKSEYVVDFPVTANNDNSVSTEKTYRKGLNQFLKQTIGADQITAESLQNFSKDKFLLNANLPSSPLNEETVSNKKQPLANIFKLRGFDIRLSKNIVAKLLKSEETYTHPNVRKILDETNDLSKPDILISENNVVDSTSICALSINSDLLPKESVELLDTKNKCKRGRKKKNIQQNSSTQRSLKSIALLPDTTENIISNVICPPDGITTDKERINVQTLPNGLDIERTHLLPTLNFKNDLPPRTQKLPCQLVDKPNVLLPTSAESLSSDLDKKWEGSSLPRKNTRLTMLKSKENSQPKANKIPVNVKEKQNCPKELTEKSIPVDSADNCTSYQATVQEKSTKSLSDIEIVEPKKELNDEAGVLQFTPTNLLTNDSFLGEIKSNESAETNINKRNTDSDMCTNSKDTFGNNEIKSKPTIFELPAFIVMKTKVITRKDLEINKILNPPLVKQQIDTESENCMTESAIKSERPEFNSVCANINSLLEQNANYLKFASGSERLTRMNNVLGDYSISVEDAKCTLKFLQSYLSSGPRDKGIKTKGQQFIPIYDSQKKIIGYRKRTIHVKPLSSHESTRRITRTMTQHPVTVTTVNVNRDAHMFENDAGLVPKIEPVFSNVGESELIVPDTTANDISIKNEENHME